MSDLNNVSPLLDEMTVGACLSQREGVSCYEVLHKASGQRFVCKHISVPASDEKAQALILAGAYPDIAAANEYYIKITDDLRRELEQQKALAECPNFCRYLRMQTVAKESGIGYEVYLLAEKGICLPDYLANNALTHLRALNLGIDLTSALAELREAGYVFQNLKPENVYLFNDTFRLGDLGLAPTMDMCYGSLPEQFISDYTAPELHDMLAGLNATIDLYALGILLYRIYNNGHAPFEDEKNTARAANARRLAGEELPAPMYADYELAEIILKACAFRQEDRFQTPVELGQALTRYMQRNEVTDTLIVPPIISEPEPLEPEREQSPEPVKFTDAEALSDDFKAHFAPNAAAVQDVIDAAKRDEQRKGKPASAEEELDALLADTEAMLRSEPMQLTQTEELPAPEAESTQPDGGEQPAEEEAAEQELPEAEPQQAPAETSQEAPAEDVQEVPAEKATEEVSEESPAPSEEDDGKLKLVELPATEEGQLTEEKPSSRRHRQRKKHSKVGWIVFAAVLLVLGIAAFVYYGTDFGRGLYHYYIRVDKIEVLRTDSTSITVKMTTRQENPPIVLSCKNPYGSSAGTAEPVEGEVVFEGLTPGTEYTIIAEPVGTHKIIGYTRCTASTAPATELLAFNITSGMAQGAVDISLAVKTGDKLPASWIVSYGYEGGEELTQSFTDSKTTLTGLTPEKEYSFRLTTADKLALTGVTQTTFTPLREVKAQALKMDSFVDGNLNVSWECTSAMPASWTLTCTDMESGESTAADITTTSAIVEGLTIGKSYLITLGTPGLWADLELEIPSDLIEITGMTAVQQDDGVLISWDAASVPDGGWLLVTELGEEEYLKDTVSATQNSYLLTLPVPNANYTFRLQAADGRGLAGVTQTQLHTTEAAELRFVNLNPDRLKLATYVCPEGDDWTYNDLDNATDSFTANQTLVYVLSANRTPTKQDGAITFRYVLRNADGSIADYNAESYEWNNAWTERRHITQLLRTPQAAGTYTLEVYISSGFAASTTFTVSEPAE